MLKKGITLVVMLLFVGTIFTPLTVSNEIEQYSVSTFNDGSLSGYVNDTYMNPIEGARVRVYFHGTYEENYTDSSGHFRVINIPICNCTKNCTASKLGYKTEWVLLSIDENTTYDFILMVNQPPNAPEIYGPTRVKVGVDYEYTFVSEDPDGDNVSYFIDWGDGNAEETDFYASGEEVKLNHTYVVVGDYTLKAKAKDIWDYESDWSSFIIWWSKNQQVSNMWYLRWSDRFPLLQKLLEILGWYT